MPTIRNITLASLCLLLSLASLHAETGSTRSSGPFNAIHGHMGTMGFGGDLGFYFSSDLAARIGINRFSYGYDKTIDDISYEGDLNLRSYSLLVDWYPFDGIFRTSAGFFLNDNNIKIKAKSGRDLNIGNLRFTPEQVGTLTGKADFDSFSPYAGVGWGNPARSFGAWSVTFDAGLVFQGAPDVSLTSSGGALSSSPLLQEELDRELKEFEDDVESFKIYPLIQIGFAFRF